jgi:hypothetical protein
LSHFATTDRADHFLWRVKLTSPAVVGLTRDRGWGCISEGRHPAARGRATPSWRHDHPLPVMVWFPSRAKQRTTGVFWKKSELVGAIPHLSRADDAIMIEMTKMTNVMVVKKNIFLLFIFSTPCPILFVFSFSSFFFFFSFYFIAAWASSALFCRGVRLLLSVCV